MIEYLLLWLFADLDEVVDTSRPTDAASGIKWFQEGYLWFEYF